ncbi:MAG: DNA helicase RecQ [Saprospiraceae bacterium]|nr:DNA helicase RecQ [Saprospiraceae bacterium]
MNLENAKAALKKYYGYDSFRPLQAEVIQAIYDKKDVLLLMPTGGGKSVCFQIPAITMEGTCVVVSPLISLMKDQVEAMRANGIRAAFLNSSLSYHEQQSVENELYHGRLDLLYTSPEKMASQEFLPLVRASKICLFAIDEAHCISAWGHDFRPEYRQLRFLKNTFPNTPVIALTATADKLTRKDIIVQAELRNPEVFIASFDRPNLSLEVRPGRKRIEQIIEFIGKRPNQPGVIYCTARKTTESLAEKLKEAGINAAAYHAGLDERTRPKVQEDFINDRTTVICATIAFGMGIDKSNVRWVIHYNLPKNIEGYYQEIGRSGRDGADANTLLFYSAQDVMMLREFIMDGEGQNRDIQLAKLERMHQYATALICRRKILLNYFNETMLENCGNCDVCKNPPQHFDGTIAAQKALSAVSRLNEQVGTGMLVDVLRGSKSYNLVSNGYDKIKTYGAGKDIRQDDWFFYLEQLINQGLLEIAYDDHSKVKLTEASRAVLFSGQKVELVKAEILQKRKEEEEAKTQIRTKRTLERERVRDELFEHLRELRLDIAREKGVPPYIVFNDTTLEEMAAMRPTTEADLSQISGVGEQKLEAYGRAFLDAIQDFLLAKKDEGIRITGATYLETFRQYKQGATVDEIAAQRGISPLTVFSHLAHLYEKGENVNIWAFLNKAEAQRVAEAVHDMEPPIKLQEVFTKLNEELTYEKIRLGIAWYNKNKR